MAGNAIGRASLILGTDGAGLQSGLKGAEKNVFQFGDNVAKELEKQNSRMGAIASRVGGVASAGLNKGLQAGLGTNLAGLTSGISGKLLGPIGIALGGIGAASETIDSLKDLANISRSAKALGLDGSAFMGLQQVFKRAGIEGDGFTGALGKIQAKISEAGNGNAQLAGLFKEIGLDARALAGIPVDEQIKRIADGFATLDNEGDRSRLALKLFEEQGLKLLPMFSKGSKGIDDFIANGKKIGTVLSNSQLLAAERATSALPKLSASFDGLKNRVVIALAPIIEKWATMGTKLLERLQPVFNWLGKAFTTVADIYWSVMDKVFDGFSQAWEAVEGWVKELVGSETELMEFEDVAWQVVEAVAQAFSIMAQRVAQAFGWTVKQAGGAIEWLGGAMGKIGLEEWGAKWEKAGQDIGKWGEDVRNKWANWDGEQAGKNWVDGLRKKLEERQAELDKAAERERKKKEEMANFIDPSRLVNTIKKDSAEAWKLEATFAQKQLLDPARRVAEAQLIEARKANGLLFDIGNKIGKGVETF